MFDETRDDSWTSFDGEIERVWMVIPELTVADGSWMGRERSRKWEKSRRLSRALMMALVPNWAAVTWRWSVRPNSRLGLSQTACSVNSCRVQVKLSLLPLLRGGCKQLTHKGIKALTIISTIIVGCERSHL